MPYLLVPIIAEIVGSVVAAEIIVSVITIVAMSLISKLLAPSNRSGQGSQLSNGATEEYSGTVEPRRIVYGTNLVSGMNAIPPWCHGTKNEMLDQVLVLAGHEVSAITDVYLNQELLPSASMSPITGTASDGLANTGSFAGKIWIRRHTGAPGDTLDYILHTAWPTYWDSPHIGAGLAKLYIQYQYDTTVYSAGKPDVRAIVLGKKVYDPRLDTTPGANVNNPSYIKYSDSPALCAIDFILDPVLGIGEAPTRIDWTVAVAAANLCDELVAIPLYTTLTPPYDASVTYFYGTVALYGGVAYQCIIDGTYNILPTVTHNWMALGAGLSVQRRYTCNAVLDCTAAYEDNLKTLAGAFQGSVLYSSGKWVLLPGHYQSPTFALGDDDVTGALQYQTALPYVSRYNAVRGQFYDPLFMYQPTEYPDIRVSADEIADGEGPVWREVQQATCISTFEAQRNAMIVQRQSRRKKTWSFPAHYGMFSIRPGDFGTLSITELSISLQQVRCTGWTLDGKALGISLSFEEVSPSDWNDPATVLYQTASMLSTPAPANFISDPVTGLSGVGGSGGITFAWTLPSIWHSNLSVELLESNTNNISFATVIWAGVNTGVFIQKSDNTVRYYWVRIRNIAGNTTSVTTPLSPSGGYAANATTPAGIPGPKGDPGPTGPGALVGSLTLQNIVLPADTNGHVTSYVGANGAFKVFIGTLDITSLCSFSLAPGGNPSNINYFLGGEVCTGQAQTRQGEFAGAMAIVITGTLTLTHTQHMVASGTVGFTAITGTGATRE